MPLLHGGEGGDGRYDGNGNHRPEHCRHGQEQQQSGQFVGQCVREAESFIDGQGRYQVDNLDEYDNPGPDPQPRGNLQYRQ